MKTYNILFFLVFLSTWVYGQDKNLIYQPYIEISAHVDSLVVPDRIYLTIVLNENDNKNKKSTEELEKILQTTLKRLNIDIEKNLVLVDMNSSFKNYFLKGLNVLKIKAYSLLLHDATMVSKVFAELEKEGISNVQIDKTEYSKADQLELVLKSKAMQKAKQSAEALLKPINQTVGKALYVNDNSTSFIQQALGGYTTGIQIRGASSLEKTDDFKLYSIEFEKIRFETGVNVKFAIE